MWSGATEGGQKPTYYFCGDRSITQTRWDLETNLAYD